MPVWLDESVYDGLHKDDDVKDWEYDWEYTTVKDWHCVEEATSPVEVAASVIVGEENGVIDPQIVTVGVTEYEDISDAVAGLSEPDILWLGDDVVLWLRKVIVA